MVTYCERGVALGCFSRGVGVRPRRRAGFGNPSIRICVPWHSSCSRADGFSIHTSGGNAMSSATIESPAKVRRPAEPSQMTPPLTQVSPEEIAQRAYELYLDRGGAHG